MSRATYLTARYLAAASAMVALAACGSGSTAKGPTPEIPPQIAYDAATFSKPTVIDNRYYPMAPGTQWTFEGTANRGTGQMPHQVIITVSDLVKDIHGIATTVVWERDVNEGVLAETELAFFAQDDHGNLWNFGEYPEEWNGKKFKGAPSTWISGQRGAQGGVHVYGNPTVGSPSYREGTAPKIGFLDAARVEGADQQRCALVGCFSNVLVIDEWSSKAEDGHQIKSYAPGLGMLRVDPRGGDEEESLLLVKHETLSPKELSAVRDAAMRLDQRAYKYGRPDYPTTSPAQPR